MLEELDIKVVKNAAYSPNYNPVEGAISVCKKSIKKKRLRSQILNRPIDLWKEIEESFMEIKKEVCLNFVVKSN